MSEETVRPQASDSSEVARVLLIDDEEKICRIFGTILRNAGFDVVTISDSAEAAYEVVCERFDAVVSDIFMPGTSGIDLLRILRAYDLDVPVILMTGSPGVDTAAEAIDLGVQQYLSKPIGSDELVQSVRRAVVVGRGARQRRAAFAAVEKEQREEKETSTDLARALARSLSQIYIAFQPIVGARDQIIGHEAFLRSNDETLSTPKAVIQAAEKLGRMPEIGSLVRDLVAVSFADAPKDALLFVNLHPAELMDPDLASQSAPLSRFAERVVFEVVERAALQDVKDVDARLSVLRFMGFRLALDDFRAGYAGVRVLSKFEPEFIKIAPELVRDIESSLVQQNIVRSIVALSREMKLRPVAEGVETKAEKDTLRKLGCELMQGYLFAEPSPQILTRL